MALIKKPPLPLKMRADLFVQLAAMEKAGLPIDKAFSAIKLSTQFQPRLEEMRKLLKRGKDIPNSGQQTGLFTEIETQLLRAATAAGSPAQTYKRLADTYSLKVRLSKNVKSRMMLPIAVFIIALLVQPLPALVSGTLSFGGYIWHTVRPFLAIACGVFLYRWLQEWLETSPPSASRKALETRLTQIPLYGEMHVRSNARDFFESLALMLEAGLPMFEALPKACKTIRNQMIRAEFSRILPRMKQDDTLGMALEDNPFLGDKQIVEFVKTGEASGTLPEMLFRHVNFETEAVANFQEQAAEWVPRIVYGGLALWMAYNLLSGNAFQPNLPSDLK